MIYCGYSGCGKSTYCKKHPETTIDLDSSSFAKTPGWELYYITKAVELSQTGKHVFISAHQTVIKCLQKYNIPFELFLPAYNKAVWGQRLRLRYALNPTQCALNAIKDFEENFDSDMAFYNALTCTKHYIQAHIVTNIEDFIQR